MKELNKTTEYLERQIRLLERMAHLLMLLQGSKDFGGRLRELERAADRLERIGREVP